MNVKIKKLCDEAVVPFKKYTADFCYDVVATSEEEIAPNVWKYGIGLAFQIDRGAELIYSELIGNDAIKDKYIPLNASNISLAIDLRPRSSIYKTGMVLSNSIGTIDEIFTGEVSAVFYHVMPTMPRYQVGDRIGQIKLGLTFPIDFIEVDELSETERGDGGYGSTGN